MSDTYEIASLTGVIRQQVSMEGTCLPRFPMVQLIDKIPVGALSRDFAESDWPISRGRYQFKYRDRKNWVPF